MASSGSQVMCARREDDSIMCKDKSAVHGGLRNIGEHAPAGSEDKKRQAC